MARKAVVVLVLLFALTPLAHAADTSERLRAALAEADRIATETPLSALFGPATVRIESGPGGMQIADAPNAEVFVARVNSDGTISTACVGTEEAARDFMSGKKKAAGPEKE
jgi:hypothetical protein